jgi:hypothetical protein
MYLIEQAGRDKDFFSVCEKIKNSAKGYRNIARIATEASLQPAHSFYLSVGEIGRLLRKHIRQLPVSAAKRDLWLELARRYHELRKQFPNESVDAIARRIEMQPAPRFYMTPKYATRLYYKLLCEEKLRNKKNCEKNRRLYHGK